MTMNHEYVEILRELYFANRNAPKWELFAEQHDAEDRAYFELMDYETGRKRQGDIDGLVSSSEMMQVAVKSINQNA